MSVFKHFAHTFLVSDILFEKWLCSPSVYCVYLIYFQRNCFFFPHITNNFHTFWANDRKSTKYAYVSCRELCLAIDFLIDNIYVRFGNSVFRQLIGIPMGTNSAPLLADLFLHTFEYDFMLRTMKQDMTKAVQFSNTFRYIDDLLSVNNENFGNYISDIYPSDLEVCFLNTRIKNGDSNTPFHLSVYDKRDDFSFTRQSGLWPMDMLEFAHRSWILYIDFADFHHVSFTKGSRVYATS